MSWTTLINALFLPGKKILGSTGMALRDNLIAVIAGAFGAPRIVGAAFMRIDDYPVLTVTAGAIAASELVDTVLGTLTTNSTSYVVAYTITTARANGTLRFNMTHRNSIGASGGSDLRILKNGVVVNTWNTTSITAVARVEDIAVIPTDVITVEHRRTGASSDSIVTQVPTASDGYIPRPAYVQVSLVSVP